MSRRKRKKQKSKRHRDKYEDLFQKVVEKVKPGRGRDIDLEWVCHTMDMDSIYWRMSDHED